MTAVSRLIELFRLEQTAEDVFVANHFDMGFRSLFGGQVLGQALMAAARTVDLSYKAHSLHAYFLRPGDNRGELTYKVNRIRDGRGFVTRTVAAFQHDRQIFELSASFHLAEDGPEHQDPMPADLLPPEELKSQQELMAELADGLDEKRRRHITRERPIEIRPVNPYNKVNPEPLPPIKRLWFRATQPLPNDPLLHQATLAYCSDFDMVGTAMMPHGLGFTQDNVLAASLDHALWIHRPFRADEWLLYSLESPNAHGARGLVRGQIFSRDGTLVASTTQEGLIRVR